MIYFLPSSYPSLFPSFSSPSVSFSSLSFYSLPFLQSLLSSLTLVLSFLRHHLYFPPILCPSLYSPPILLSLLHWPLILHSNFPLLNFFTFFPSVSLLFSYFPPFTFSLFFYPLPSFYSSLFFYPFFRSLPFILVVCSPSVCFLCLYFSPLSFFHLGSVFVTIHSCFVLFHLF